MKSILASLLLISSVTPALAGDRGSSPMRGFLQGQAVEQGLAQAEIEGYRAEMELRGYTSPRQRPGVRRSPVVTNPYSPYLGLPSNIAEGLVQQQLLDIQDQIQRLEEGK